MRAWTDDDLTTAVRESQSLIEVVRRLGISVSGGSYSTLNKRIAALELDTSHFRGQGWRRDLHMKGDPFVYGSPYTTCELRKKLVNLGFKNHRCEECGIEEWRGRPLRMHLHHINGDRRDNRIENLSVLCPNCHLSSHPTRKPRVPVGTASASG